MGQARVGSAWEYGGFANDGHHIATTGLIRPPQLLYSQSVNFRQGCIGPLSSTYFGRSALTGAASLIAAPITLGVGWRGPGHLNFLVHNLHRYYRSPSSSTC